LVRSYNQHGGLLLGRCRLQELDSFLTSGAVGAPDGFSAMNSFGWPAKARAIASRCCWSSESLATAVDFLVEALDDTEARPPPLVADTSPKRTRAGNTPRVAGHLAHCFFEFDVLVTATVWRANLDDWLGRSKSFMDADRLDAQDPNRRGGLMDSRRQCVGLGEDDFMESVDGPSGNSYDAMTHLVGEHRGPVD